MVAGTRTYLPLKGRRVGEVGEVLGWWGHGVNGAGPTWCFLDGQRSPAAIWFLG